MARLRGTGLGVGMALGTAAVARTRQGIPMLPEAPARIAEQIALHRLTETPEVILVAEDYRSALAMVGALSWAKVVGIAAEKAEPDAPVTGIPAVVHVSGLLNFVADAMLMLVDAERGLVFADPDPVSLGQYTAEHDHISPKRRFYLDDAHLPAQTLDGRIIQVMAWTEDAESVSLALTAGADALCVPLGSALLPAGEEEATLQHNLLELAESVAGKPLVLLDNYELPLTAVLEAATRADIILAEPPRMDLNGLGLAEQAEAIQAAEVECLENDRACSLPRLAADVTMTHDPYALEPDTDWIGALATRGATRLFFGLSYDAVEAFLPQLEAICSAATEQLLPVIPHLSAFLPDEAALHRAVELLVALGVAGVMVEPGQVAAAKEWIRALNFSERREELLESIFSDRIS